MSAAYALDPATFEPYLQREGEPQAILAAALENAKRDEWMGKCADSLKILAEEVDAGWFRDSHPEAHDCWEGLLRMTTRTPASWLENLGGLTSPEKLQALLSRPAFADTLDDVEHKSRRRCLDPELEDLLALVSFLKRNRSRWIIITS